VRTAFVVDTSEEETEGKHPALCLKVATNTQSVLTQPQEVAEKHNMEGIAQVYPGAMWGESHLKCKNKMEICDASLFALELGITQGKHAYSAANRVELYAYKDWCTAQIMTWLVVRSSMEQDLKSKHSCHYNWQMRAL
jgi:hypothetical protein